MRKEILVLTILLLPLLAFGQVGYKRPCPYCDLPLKGFAVGGFGGLGLFSVDSDSPYVADEMGLDEMPSIATRVGGGFYFYPAGNIRLGLLGGMNWAGVTEGDNSLKANAIWAVVMPEFVRTTGAMRIYGGLGIGGGMASVTAQESGVAADEQTDMFTLYPKAGIELPFSENVMLSFELSYLWLLGDTKTLSWEVEDVTRDIDFTPGEFGGPSASLSLYFGRVYEAENYR